MINVDAYPVLFFSNLTCHVEDTEIVVLWSHCVVHDSKETKLGISNQEVSPSAGKNTGVVLVPCCTWKCNTTAVSGGVDVYKVPVYHVL